MNWSEIRKEPHTTLLDCHQQLIRLRRQEPALSDGHMDLVRTSFDESSHWFILERGPITVAFNLASSMQSVPIRPGARQILLASDPSISLADGAVKLPPDSIAVIKY